MTTAYNGRIFNAQVAEKQPFVIVWDGQVLAYSGVQAIIAGTPRLEAAREFRPLRRPAGGNVQHRPAHLLQSNPKLGTIPGRQ